MGTLYFDFESDTPGSVPAGWTLAYVLNAGAAAVTDVSGDKKLVYTPNPLSPNNLIYAIDSAANLDDVVLSGELTLTSGSSANFYLRAGNNDGFPQACYWVQITEAETNIYRVTAGNATTLANESKTHTAAAVHEFTVEVTGTTIRAKAWTGAEPTWDASTTDGTYSSGYVLVGAAQGITTYNNVGVESGDLPSAAVYDLFFKYKDADGDVHTLQFWRGALPTEVHVTEVSTTHTASDTPERINADASGGAFTISLPTAVGREGYLYTVKKTDSSANAITIDPYLSETIDGDSSFDVEFEDEVVCFYSDNADWWIE